MNSWVHGQAERWHVSDMCKVYACVSDGRLIGLFCLSMTSIESFSVPKSVRSGMSRVSFPAILIDRLAVDVGCQGSGVGRALVSDAIERSVELADSIGAKFVVVDPKSGLGEWYRNQGFRYPPDETDGRMFLPMKAARRMVRGGEG